MRSSRVRDFFLRLLNLQKFFEKKLLYVVKYPGKFLRNPNTTPQEIFGWTEKNHLFFYKIGNNLPLGLVRERLEMSLFAINDSC
jgi:hypothetical protein